MSAPALTATEDVIMSPELDAAEFLRLSRTERIAKCREMAAEAQRLAKGKTAELNSSYLGLAEKWFELADEIEALGAD